MGKRPPRNGKLIKDENILLVDGNSLFKVSYHGAKNMYNSRNEHIGGIFQFLTHLRKLMNENMFHKVIVFWDGNKGGKLRYDVYSDYKISRNKDYINGSIPTEPEEIAQEKQKRRVWQYLEELSIRQLSESEVESDDFIAYLCINKKENQKITICSGDADLSQLVNDDVTMYYLKKFNGINYMITPDNFEKYFKFHRENVLLWKMLTGDSSDDIKGVKGLGEKTLLKHFPEIAEKPITLEYVIDKAKALQAERLDNKQSRIQVLDNIINGVTNGVQGDKLYEINEYIINLKKPLLTESAVEDVNQLMESEIDPKGRSIKNAYIKLKENGINEVLGEARFVDYLLPFKKLIERERNNRVLN